jgi:hypothetical protein
MIRAYIPLNEKSVNEGEGVTAIGMQNRAWKRLLQWPAGVAEDWR